jgi:hypothetical protein
MRTSEMWVAMVANALDVDIASETAGIQGHTGSGKQEGDIGKEDGDRVCCVQIIQSTFALVV